VSLKKGEVIRGRRGGGGERDGGSQGMGEEEKRQVGMGGEQRGRGGGGELLVAKRPPNPNQRTKPVPHGCGEWGEVGDTPPP